jgi:hypothetical protein
MTDQASGNITAGYTILFGICGSAYLIAFAANHLLARKFEPIKFPAERAQGLVRR